MKWAVGCVCLPFNVGYAIQGSIWVEVDTAYSVMLVALDLETPVVGVQLHVKCKQDSVFAL